MSKRRRLAIACMGTVLALGCLYAAWGTRAWEHSPLPGTGEKRRVILRVWDVDGPTGSSAWLRGQCAEFEKHMPGLTVYLRSVPASECYVPGTVLPDVLCFADGTFASPQQLLVPLRDMEGVTETFAQSGRWQTKQYALPLAAEGWMLAVGEAYLPAPAQTPAPTTLLGRAVATPQAERAAMPPLDVLRKQDIPLAARGQGLFALGIWLGVQPLPLPQEATTQASVLTALTRGEAASALLSTGQWATLENQMAQGQCAGFQAWVPPEMPAPRMLYAGITETAQPEAAALLSYLIAAPAQQALSQQRLFSVREDVLLYFSSPWVEMERVMGAHCFPVNAFWPKERVETAARGAYQGTLELEAALAELR